MTRPTEPSTATARQRSVGHGVPGENEPVDGQGQQPRWRKTWSMVQVGVLSAAVIGCIVLLLTGDGSLDRVYAVALVFFGIALLGHVTFLVLTARAERQR